MTTNVSSCSRALRIRLALGTLEREEHTAADVERVFERLEPRRQWLPFVMAEVGVRRAARHDQVVVGQLAVGEYQSLRRWRSTPRTSASSTSTLRLTPQNPPNRRGDVARRQRCHRHLIEQRLEDVMVAAIDDGQLDASVAQGAGGIEAAESTADDDDMGNRHGKATAASWYHRRAPPRINTVFSHGFHGQHRRTTSRSTAFLCRLVFRVSSCRFPWLRSILAAITPTTIQPAQSNGAAVALVERTVARAACAATSAASAARSRCVNSLHERV